MFQTTIMFFYSPTLLIFQYGVVFGGKDEGEGPAPVEIIRFEDDQDWLIIEMSDQKPLPLVGMKSLIFEDKFYILGGMRLFFI